MYWIKPYIINQIYGWKTLTYLFYKCITCGKFITWSFEQNGICKSPLFLPNFPPVTKILVLFGNVSIHHSHASNKQELSKDNLSPLTLPHSFFLLKQKLNSNISVYKKTSLFIYPLRSLSGLSMAMRNAWRKPLFISFQTPSNKLEPGRT